MRVYSASSKTLGAEVFKEGSEFIIVFTLLSSEAIERGVSLPFYASKYDMKRYASKESAVKRAEAVILRSSSTNPVGPPRKIVSGRRVNVYLDAASLEKAAALGGGNVSEGIRKALDK